MKQQCHTPKFMRLDSQRELTCRLDASKKFEIIQAMIRHLDIQGSGTTVTPRQINDAYFKLPIQKKDSLWRHISQETCLPKELIEKYYFYDFSRQAYSGDISLISYDITKRIAEYQFTPSTNVQDAMKWIYSQLSQQIKKLDIHPGSVQQTIYNKLQVIRQSLTPKKSSGLRCITVYTSQTPTAKPKDEIVAERRSETPEDDLQQMINALTEIVNQYQK